MGGIDLQREEFFSQHKMGMMIWVTDKQRSWGNNLNVEGISEHLKRLVDDKEIFIIGNSMGGFLGILFSQHLKPKKVLSFVPQFSVNIDVVPTEIRYVMYTSKIQSFKYKCLSNCFYSQIQYVIIMGTDHYDHIHFSLFKKYASLPNVQLLRLTNCTHNVAKFLKDSGTLNSFIDTCFSNKDLNIFFEENRIAIG